VHFGRASDARHDLHWTGRYFSSGSVSEGKSDRSTRKDRKAGLQVIQNLVMLHAPSGI
jgi:hypothetical protein